MHSPTQETSELWANERRQRRSVHRFNCQVLPWVESAHTPGDPRTPEQLAGELAAQRKHGLSQWSIGEPELRRYVQRIAPRVITPGSSAGELLHVLSSLERRSERWDHSAAELAGVIKGLEPRWFLVRKAHDPEGVKLVMPRYAMSFMKGPMTRSEIRRAVEEGWRSP